MIPDKEFLKVDDVIDIIRYSINKKKSLSLVRVGDGENIILAQSSVWDIDDVLKQNWSRLANQKNKDKDKSRKGVNLPNYEIQEEMVRALKKADIVGIPFWKNDPILTRQYLKRPLTEKTFNYFNIIPNQICHTFVNRVMTQKKEFWSCLKGKRVLLIGNWAGQAEKILERKPYDLDIAATMNFAEYDQMEETLKNIYKLKDNFDVALICCGVNAVILAQKIAEETGKVAIDFGKSFKLMVQKKAGLHYSSSKSNEDLIP